MDLRSERVVMWAGLIVCAGIYVEVIIAVAAGQPLTSPLIWTDSQAGSLAIVTATLAAFAATFAWVMRAGITGARPRALVLALVLMCLVGTLLRSDLSYIVAMALPCVLRRRIAVLWLVVWNALAMVFVVAWLRANASPGEVEATMQVWVLALAITPHVTWQLWAFAIGLVAATEGQGRAELARNHRKLIAAQSQLADRARLEERVEIARDLHDTIGHHLAALNVQLELARHLTDGAARDAVAKAHDTGKNLLGDVRAIVSVWRDDAAVDLPSELARLALEIDTPEIVVTIAPGLRVEQPEHAKALLRCAQEAITNAVRHADARHVWVDLTRDDGWLRLSARDDGRGQDAVAPGNGLRGLEERAVALGGQLVVDARAGAGFTLAMRLPEAS